MDVNEAAVLEMKLHVSCNQPQVHQNPFEKHSKSV